MLSEGNTTVDRSGRELLEHGTVTFPIACYYDDLRACGVVCHWHEELEAALVSEGNVAVTIGSRTRTLQAG
ncbi:MAG: AraC family transcriptional regulator, partial [Blautia massiliensis (ex Durand et al. 2017)]